MSDDPDAGTATLRSRLAVLGAAAGGMGAWAIGAMGRSGRVAAAHVGGVRRMPILPAAVLAIAVAACAQAVGTQQPVATALTPSVAPTVRTAEPPAPTPLNPAPAKMISRWTSEVATVDITPTRLAISAVDFPTSMRLEVFGQELVLSHSTLCSGDGRYRWSIEGDTLRFESVGPDPCERRQPTFDGVTYTRVPS